MAEVSTRRSILVVEDDRITRTTIRAMVARRFPGITIHVAENGRIGLELCREHAPALVITDLNMPEMDGMSMMEEIRTQDSGTRFIVMTGYSDRYHVEHTSHLDISGFLVKPVELRELFEASERALGEPRRANG